MAVVRSGYLKFMTFDKNERPNSAQELFCLCLLAFFFSDLSRRCIYRIKCNGSFIVICNTCLFLLWLEIFYSLCSTKEPIQYNFFLFSVFICSLSRWDWHFATFPKVKSLLHQKWMQLREFTCVCVCVITMSISCAYNLCCHSDRLGIRVNEMKIKEEWA